MVQYYPWYAIWVFLCFIHSTVQHDKGKCQIAQRVKLNLNNYAEYINLINEFSITLNSFTQIMSLNYKRLADAIAGR